jgi:hypothetical protein
MAKDSRTKRAAQKLQSNRVGRPPRDPDTLRTDRLVLRTHPDLINHLESLAKKNGLTRSMLCERALISFVNLNAGFPVLDSMGREPREPVRGDDLGTPASFDQIWRRAVAG